MINLPPFISKRLSVKILLALTVGVAIVMGVIICLGVTSQRRQIRERMTTSAQELQFLAYAGIKHPMSVGDSASVEKQLLDVKEHLHDAEIVICDFNQRIVFATHAERINATVSGFIHNPAAITALGVLLEGGASPGEKYFEEKVGGKRFLVTIHSMPNEKECHHCHGASRKVLGGMIIRQSTDETYAVIAALRNRTILVSVLGIGALIAIIYYMLGRLVTRPVDELASKAEQLAQGDLSVSVAVSTEDAIGVLGRSFNAMVASIKDQIEYASSLKEAIADPLFMVDTGMVITYMNEACAQLTGYSKEEVEGRMTCRQVFRSDICESTCPLRYCFDSGKPVSGVRATMTSRTGKPVPLMASASPLRDAHGALVGGVEICRDITEVLEAERLQYIKKAAAREEEQRRYLEERVTSLLNTLSLVAEGDLNKRAEVLDKNDMMDEIAGNINLMLDDLEKLYERISSFSKDLELEVARRTMMLREKTLLLERANRELRELDRLKSAFLANMSHELRTPMNSIIGYTDLLLDRIDGEINEEQEKSLRKVVNNARHLLQLINDILDMSKIESGKIELDPHEASIKNLAETYAATFEPAMNKKGLKLVFDFSDDLPPVYIDEDKIGQVFLNLISNAVKFTNSGEIRISAYPSQRGIKPGEPPRFVEVCIADTGIGIKQGDIDKLFDKFSQIDVSSIREYEGTGLGLSIARGLVVLHKGMIWVESRFGRGSRFCFTLPARKDLLEKPSEVIIEPMMAEELASYFDKPVQTFLKEPRYAGKPIKCWEYVHCGQTSCPAYGSKDHRCWLIFGTHCKGTKVASFPEKSGFCRGCEIIERVIMEEYDSSGSGLERTGKNSGPAAGDGERKMTVLAIDDNPEMIEIISKYLGREYNVVGLQDSARAVATARELQPAAITLDIRMPGKNGWQVLLELKQDPQTQDIPVIILSIVDEKRLGFSLGAAEYIVKPVDKNLLLRKLDTVACSARIKRVLVVETDPEVVGAIRPALEEAGCQVTVARDNRQARDEIQKAVPDLIVMNLIMPDVDGTDMIAYLKSNKAMRHIPLVLITERQFSKAELDRLDGRVETILNRKLLTMDDMLRELTEILRRYYT
ncbi:MAG: response regulator [Desulfobacterales bacterium]|nr:response regulator [Desulfobacterales bacterium]